ncbi:hypothetical protein chiPu_0023061, partial [Chiloscyllium punctatum]|nr:hypothetical protein [Chiloscyllium punctatum]
MSGSLHPSASLGKPRSERQQLECYKAAFDYTAWAEDELNLRKGDVILVLEKGKENRKKDTKQGWYIKELGANGRDKAIDRFLDDDMAFEINAWCGSSNKK